ncbi:hypothetical protein L9F63_011745, partial [Diploptera punctata]
MFIAKNYSRKITGYLVAVPYFIAYVLTILASNITLLYIARIFAGIGTGATTVFCPLYVTEISEDKIRGTLGSFYVLICGFGILAIYIFGAYLSYYVTCYILIAIMVVYLVTFYFIPETPVYLINHIHFSDARKSLNWLRGSNCDVIEQEMCRLKSSLEKKEEGSKSISIKEMLQNRSIRIALLISLFLVTNLQFSGPLAILSYTVTIFKDAGSDLSANTSTIIIAFLQIVGNLFATVLLDRAGRKILLIISNIAIILSLTGLGIYFYCKMNGIDISKITWIPLLCLSIYILFFALGVSPVPFIMIPELFLPEAREMAIAISLTVMWFLAFLATKLFTTISDIFGLYGLNIASLVHGVGIGWPSPIIPILQSETSPIGRAVTNEEASWLSAIICLGSMFNIPIYYLIVNKCSRKFTGYLVAVPYAIAYILVICANNVTMLYIARFFAGMGTGATTLFCPLYVTEISENSVRGALGSLYVLISYVGVLFVYICASYTTYYVTSYLILAVTALYLIAFFFMPESPSYLVQISNLEAAEKNLKWLRGDDNVVKVELDKLTAAFKERQNESEQFSIKEIFSSRGTRKAYVIAFLLAANLQLSAPIATLSYTVSTFQAAGSDMSPNLSSIIVSLLQILGTSVSTLLLDRAGRKVLLGISNFCLILCLTTNGAYFFCKSNGIEVSNVSWIPLLCLSVYVISLGIGVAPIPFLMVPEMFLPRARSLAVCVSLTWMWFIAFLVTKFYANVSELFGLYSCYWLFAAFCFIGLLMTIFVYPETKNKSIENIFEELDGGEKSSKKYDVSNSK